jgi:putative intracellular protease/amidase
MARILLALATADFDPTEAAIPWSILTRAGHDVSVATAGGARAAPDSLMLTGEGLDLWGAIPGVKKAIVVGAVLRANGAARSAFFDLAASSTYSAPLPFERLHPGDWDGVILPGGHRAAGIRPYLEDEALRGFVASIFAAEKPVGAICHGVVVAARARRADGRSVLYGRKTTGLTWQQEKLANQIANITRFWDRDYYRTYVEEAGEPSGFRSVESEVRRALAAPEDFLDVARDDDNFRRKTDGMHRDSDDDARPAFVVRDGNYVSARWPGDAFTFAKTFVSLF